MCGIAGIINFSSESVNQKEKNISNLRKMSQSISHRGRDGEGEFFNETSNCFLAHRRLSILDLSSSADQPMRSLDNRFSIIFNGEIYNFKEIKIELEKLDIQFKTTSDTEVLLYAYQVWGRECLKKLRGIFSFAIWDDLNKKLFAARDHLGVKPFYWFYNNNDKLFLFASELKAILSNVNVKKNINLQAIDQYLSFYSVNPPQTLIQDIFQLESGHYLEFSVDGLKIEKYWDLQDFKTDESLQDLNQIKSNLREKLLQVTELQMRSDVDVGAFLSGGLDSATIVGLMSKLTDKKIHTFNISFGNEGSYIDESGLAKKVASKFNCNHHEVKIGASEFKSNFEEFIKAIDQPSGDGINSFLVSKFTAQHVSVALSGLGGDEVFLGYRYFQDLKNLQNFQSSKIKRKFLPAISKLYKNNKYFRSFAYRNKLDFLKFWPAQKDELYFNGRTLFPENEKQKLLTFNLKNEIKSYGAIKTIFSSEKDTLNAFSKAELSWYTPGMLLRDCDATSMFSTLEVRVPFLDHKLVEFLLTVPSAFKIQKNQKINKPLLANLFDDLLPPEILTYPKHGFEMPIGFWLKEKFAYELNDLKTVSWLNKNYVEFLLNQFNQNPREYLKVWSLLVLNNWLREYNI